MRMSTSSSTIRMSCAMTGSAQLSRLVGHVRMIRRASLGGGEYQHDPRPARFPIFQNQLSLVIFHNLLNYRETQAGPFRARRHIRLGQPLTALLRQAFAVDLDDYRGLAPLIGHRRANMSCKVCPLLGHSYLDRLDRILYDIDQGLTNETRVAANCHRTGWEIRLKGNLGMGSALQEHRLARDLDQVFRPEHRRRHPCKRGEFVDHAADITHMPDDRIGADREGFRVVLDLLEISAPQPLRRQLDRGQWVLDLVRNATGDIGPGCLALCRQQFGNVVECDDEAADFAAVMLGRAAPAIGRVGPGGALPRRATRPFRAPPPRGPDRSIARDQLRATTMRSG